MVSLYDLWTVPEAHGGGAANALRERQRSRAGGPSGANQRLIKGRLIPFSYRCATLQRPGVSINRHTAPAPSAGYAAPAPRSPGACKASETGEGQNGSRSDERGDSGCTWCEASGKLAMGVVTCGEGMGRVVVSPALPASVAGNSRL